MADLTRTQLIATLNDGWGTYVTRYRALSPGEQQQWLAAQGYPRFGDLLAHVVAWWVDGQQVIAHVAANPAYPLRDYDVDTFNAAAVAQYAGAGRGRYGRRLRTGAGGLDLSHRWPVGRRLPQSKDRRPPLPRDYRPP